MNRIDFQNFTQLISFLNYVTDFNTWETVLISMIASSGMQLQINTQINDPLGLNQYVAFNKIQPMIQNFFNSNGYLPITLRLKLRCPDSLRKQMDPANYYSDFYVNFYSNNISTYSTISFVETSKNLNSTPVTAWALYITNLYTQWNQKISY